MVGSRAYDLMYRFWAPWDSVGLRKDLVAFLETGQINPQSHPRAIDLGCGTGANVVHLASVGFEAYGVDFSEVAVRKARERAVDAGVDARFVLGDLTARRIEGVDGPFDFIIDFGTLDDLRGEKRTAMAATIDRLARSGSVFLEYCFYGPTEELPRISFSGTSKMSHIAPGELELLFGHGWDIETFVEYEDARVAVFILTRRSPREV